MAALAIDHPEYLNEAWVVEPLMSSDEMTLVLEGGLLIGLAEVHNTLGVR